MYCKNCGSEIADGSKFCSQCGTPVDTVPKAAPVQASENSYQRPDTEKTASMASASYGVADAAKTGGSVSKDENTEETKRPSFEEFQWDVSEYPDRNSVGKTEDIDFNWNADPRDIPDARTDAAIGAGIEGKSGTDVPTAGDLHKDTGTEEVLTGENLENAIFGETSPQKDAEPMSAAERIDKFYTFNKKNEEFQQLLDREYNRVKSGNAIESELSQAEARANERFESRPVNSTMEEFLESEGIVKPYQPKAFESDVLQRIEAQEAEKEAKRLEEEARLAAIEEARKEAEAKKLEEEAKAKAAEEAARLEEEARIKAAEEAARLEEIAKAKAAEEARLAEEARIKAEEEAKRKIEEEARIRAEAEARQRAEAQARVRAEEEARLKAEADLKAAQEAAKIRAQQEARLAAEEEARFKAEQERRRLADIEAKRKLEEERQKLAEQANQAVAREEARKVLEQTARMREEEAAKIKAAVAGLRSGAAAGAAHAADMKTPHVRKEVEEAHIATKNQINEMARARDEFFADYEDTGADSAKEAKRSVGRDAEDLSRTRTVDKEAILSGVSDDTVVVSKRAIEKEAGRQYEDADDAFFDSLDAAAAAGTAAAGAAVAAASDVDEVSADSMTEAEPIDFRDDVEELALEEEDNLQDEPVSPVGMEKTQQFSHEQFSAVSSATNPALQDTVVMENGGARAADFSANDFDSYGDEEARRYKDEQARRANAYDTTAGTAMDEFYSDDFEDESELSKKELKQREKERKRLEKQQAKEAKARKKKGVSEDDEYDEEESGGKGRLALKIVLVILIIILAAEVVGMGIKFIAPQSRAAEFIDSQLNKVIQLITGDDTEYSVIAAQVRTEPMEDKTDLINAQKDKNADNNIESIVYSADLQYDQERESDISDLVLSQPMTQVEWGRDEDNYPVYYDEQVVGEIIAFESQKYNLMNNGDEEVLSLIDAESDLYSETAALSNQGTDGAFSKLEIGEIRQAGSHYYVWVRETIGGTTTEKVYSMYPEKEFVLKMSACYEV